MGPDKTPNHLKKSTAASEGLYPAIASLARDRNNVVSFSGRGRALEPLELQNRVLRPRSTAAKGYAARSRVPQTL